MNWFWAFWFKDKFRTPLSVYKMSLAEIVVLCSMIFGVGWGLGKGVKWILNLEGVISS
jgi:antibiotic biosynthesis monooxygenase (ABM) superfamily enzyme